MDPLQWVQQVFRATLFRNAAGANMPTEPALKVIGATLTDDPANGQTVLTLPNLGGQSITTFGAKCDGVTDDSGALQAAINALAGTGVDLLVPYTAGGMLINSTITPKSNLRILVADAATIKLNIPGSSTANAFLYYTPAGLAVASTTLSVTPTAFGTTVTLTSGTSVAVGAWLGIFNATWGFRGGYYKVVAWNAGTKVATLDRQILWPFASGDTVSVFATDPTLSNFSLIGLGKGANLVGKCCVVTNLVGSRECEISGFFLAANGANVANDAGLVWQEGYRNRQYDVWVDGTGGAFPNKGHAVIAQESFDGRRLYAKNTAGYAYGIVDCYDCNFDQLRADSCLYGVALSTETAATGGIIGCRWCNLTKVTVIGCTNDGIVIYDGASNNSISQFIVATCGSQGVRISSFAQSFTQNGNSLTHGRIYNNVGDGILLDATTTQTVIDDVRSDGNGASGLELKSGAAGTRVGALYTSGNVGPQIATADEIHIGYHEVAGTAVTAGGSCLYVTGTKPITIESHKWDLSTDTHATFYAYVAAAAQISLGRGRVTMNSSSICYAALAAGVAFSLSDCVVANAGGAAGTSAVYGTGGVIRVGQGCDFTGTTIPINNAGVAISMAQQGMLTDATTTGTRSLTQVEAQNGVIKETGALTGNLTINVPAGVSGLEYEVDNSTSNAFTVSIGVTGGAAIAVAQGKKASLYSDGANMKRVGPDT